MLTGRFILIRFVLNLNVILAKTDAAIELCLSHIEDNFFSCTEIEHSHHNLIKEERQATHNLKNDQSTVIKEADKSSAIVISDKKDCLMEV